MLTHKLISRARLTLLLLALLSVWAVPAQAASKTYSTAQASATAKPSSVDISSDVASTYSADPTVQQGMVVQLKNKTPDYVIPVSAASQAKILGVVVPNANVPIVLTPANVTQQQVLVATTGRFDVLVSNQNGPIKIGDYLSISAIAGVAMKASINDEQVIGRATTDFTGSGNVISSIQLKDQLGKDTSVSISRVVVDIGVVHNPLNQKTVDFVPAFLVGLAQAVANKSVSVARIYLSSVVIFVTTIVTAVMLYSGIRSGMVAVGRNPLSKKSIIVSLIQTVVAGLIIFIVGILAVYLLLKL